MKYIKLFKQVRLTDIPLVGGKTAGIGELIAGLTPRGVRVPDGFAITVDAYWHYLEYNDLKSKLQDLLSTIKNINDLDHLAEVGSKARHMV